MSLFSRLRYVVRIFGDTQDAIGLAGVIVLFISLLIAGTVAAVLFLGELSTEWAIGALVGVLVFTTALQVTASAASSPETRATLRGAWRRAWAPESVNVEGVERGILDITLEAPARSERLNKVLRSISKKMNQTRPKLEEQLAAFTAAQDTKDKRKKGDKLARTMRSLADFIDGTLPKLSETGGAVTDDAQSAVDWVGQQSGGGHAVQLQSFRHTVKAWLLPMSGALEGIVVFRDWVLGWRGLSYSRSLNAATERLADALEDLRSAVSGVSHAYEKVVISIDKRLGP